MALDLTAAVDQIRVLLASGAELEQRDIEGVPVAYTDDGTPDNVWPIGPEPFEVEPEPDTDDGHPVVWFCPLFRAATVPTDDGGIAFDGGFHQMRPITVVRFDALADGNVGMQHDTGSYSVLRPVTDPGRKLLIDAWVQGPLTY